ncbi:hypothetical protein TIFTF001_014796 [Ficus carica]|uniref:Uncharacterized protein n=1 Tax=Ficus carica TaxID=3494 RepID=A0AA88D4F8_FICCA|nr:hypothetical protein TIFTF001_014796 [Ficus carica]
MGRPRFVEFGGEFGRERESEVGLASFLCRSSERKHTHGDSDGDDDGMTSVTRTVTGGGGGNGTTTLA